MEVFLHPIYLHVLCAKLIMSCSLCLKQNLDDSPKYPKDGNLIHPSYIHFLILMLVIPSFL